IAGMGAAARAVHAAGKVPERLIHLRDTFENHLNHIAADARIAGQGGPRLANTSLFAIPGLSAEKALIAFDLAGVALSSGSACSSGKVRASHVLRAMGAAEWVIEGALRVSIGPATREEDLERCLAVLARQLRGRGNRPRSAA
ncbi:MAG: aminotransferase class V-fold PLP-dependent enzyme, partial [Rhabdaerophilum calidifontis]